MLVGLGTGYPNIQVWYIEYQVVIHSYIHIHVAFILGYGVSYLSHQTTIYIYGYLDIYLHATISRQSIKTFCC